MTALLPEGFETAEPFVAHWVLPDANARMHRRQATPIADLRHFYETMLPLGESALDWLRRWELGMLPPGGERLLKLMLALAEVAPAVEWYNDPRVYDGVPVERFRYVRQIPDNAVQA
jgi:hypothetical protein